MTDDRESRWGRRMAPMVTIFVATFAGLGFASPFAGAQQPSLIVALKNHLFEPVLVEVKPGDTIRFDNADDTLHSLTLLGREDVIGEEFVDPGGSYTIHIPAEMAPGTYELDCTIHVDMRAKLLVRER